MARLQFVSDTMNDMRGADDAKRRELARHNMEAIESAAERLSVLHNEMDLIRESGEGSPVAESNPAEATRETLCVIKQQTDALPDGPLKDAANDLADGILHDLDGTEARVPVNEALYDYSAQLESLAEVGRAGIVGPDTIDIDQAQVLRVIERGILRIGDAVEDCAGRVRRLESQP